MITSRATGNALPVAFIFPLARLHGSEIPAGWRTGFGSSWVDISRPTAPISESNSSANQRLILDECPGSGISSAAAGRIKPGGFMQLGNGPAQAGLFDFLATVAPGPRLFIFPS